jgi:hypothetical protein
VLGACGDDDKPSPKEQLTFDGETLSLKDANVFLVDAGALGDAHNYHDYIITDGTSGGSGATFYIELTLAVPDEEEVGTGTYPVFEDYSDASETSNIGDIYAESGEDDEFVELYIPDGADGDDDLVISGGVEDGDNMTVKFNGTLTYYHLVGEDWEDENITAKLYFKGKVEDISSEPAKAKQFTRSEKRVH